MRWLDWAVDDPAPGNCGYSALNIPCELADPSLRRGLVLHSVEGWFTYVSPSGVMASRGNSWGVTIMRSGQVWRHRTRPTFVNWHAGGPAQNIGTDGIEMEGKDQPWTPAQRASLVRVLQETRAWFGWPACVVAEPTDRTQEGIRQALLAHGYGSLWEHRWFDYTTCPSGRDDWSWLVPTLAAEEDDMTTGDLASVLRTIQRKKGRGDPLTTEEQALFDSLVALLPHTAPAYIDLVLGRPSGQKAQRSAWARIVSHPHRVASPSAAGLLKLPTEFAGKWPAWNVGAFIRYGFALLRRRDTRIAALTTRVKALEASSGSAHPHTATVTSEVKLS